MTEFSQNIIIHQSIHVETRVHILLLASINFAVKAIGEHLFLKPHTVKSQGSSFSDLEHSYGGSETLYNKKLNKKKLHQTI